MSVSKFLLFIRKPVTLDQETWIVQDDLILTNDVCRDPISKLGHSLGVRTSST